MGVERGRDFAPIFNSQTSLNGRKVENVHVTIMEATQESPKLREAPEIKEIEGVPNIIPVKIPQVNGHRIPGTPESIRLKSLNIKTYQPAPGDEPRFFDKYILPKKDGSDFLKEYPDAMMLSDFMKTPDAFKHLGREVQSKWNKTEINLAGKAKVELTPHENGNSGVLHIPSEDTDSAMQLYPLHKNGAVQVVENGKELTLDLIFPQIGTIDVIRITKNKVKKRVIKKNEMDLEENKKIAAIGSKIAEKWALRSDPNVKVDEVPDGVNPLAPNSDYKIGTNFTPSHSK